MLKFNLPKTIWIRNEKETKVNASLEVINKECLSEISSIKLRFTGSLVTKSKTHAGSVKLFEKTITISDGIESLEPGERSFNFNLSLPSVFPSSVKTPTVYVEYLLVAQISFNNWCCSSLPFFQRPSLSCRKYLNVQNLNLKQQFFDRLESLKSQWVGLVDHYLVYSPDPNLVLKIPPISCPNSIQISVQTNEKIDQVLIDYELKEISLFEYKLNYKIKEQSSKVEKQIHQFKSIDQLVFEFKDCFTNSMESDQVSSKEQFQIKTLKFKSDAGTPRVDLDTPIATITHSLNLSILIQSRGSKEFSIYNIELPIQIIGTILDSSINQLYGNSTVSELKRQTSQDTLFSSTPEAIRKRRNNTTFIEQVYE